MRLLSKVGVVVFVVVGVVGCVSMGDKVSEPITYSKIEDSARRYRDDPSGFVSLAEAAAGDWQGQFWK
ncbi:MAG: hypothetical protein LBT00_10085 [Spirochaetaceae bacterium]|nr:hypothetical protein [Spirochaetaceae bacterium]